MERISIPQLLILLAFFHLFITSTAVPSTRVQRVLLHAIQVEALNDTPERITSGESRMEDVISRRMDWESNDYPGSGANNRHTPKPPGRRLM